MIIAIDGPSGAGKSTVAAEVAKQISFNCLDTGAMYRSIAWYALEHGLSPDDGEALGRVAAEQRIEFGYAEGVAQRTFIGGTEVTDAIRTARVDRFVSAVATHSQVREALVNQQRRIGSAGDYVVEGRDIGTVVFPDAEVKVFLTASAEERARRRVEQNASCSVGSLDYDEVLADIRRRDNTDSSREVSPLVPAQNAVILDSTSEAVDEVVERIVGLARQAGAGLPKPGESHVRTTGSMCESGACQEAPRRAKRASTRSAKVHPRGV